MRPSSTCICKHIRPLQTKTRFIILMHPKEYKREKNGTGHITNLQLENSEVKSEASRLLSSFIKLGVARFLAQKIIVN